MTATVATAKQDSRPSGRSRKVTRRRLLAGLAATGLLGLGAADGTFRPRITRRTLWFANLPPGWDGARLLHLTDLHRGPMVPAAYLRRALEAARRLPHEMLLLTGDYVSRRADYVHEVTAMLGGWTPPLGVWATLGNHDHQTDPAVVTQALEGVGIPVLNNSGRTVRRNGDALWLAGTDDPATSHHDVPASLTGARPGMFRMMLAHSPDVAWDYAEDAVDLALCGHTHGGQICLPNGQAIITATSLGVDYAKGVFRWRGATIFVNRGLGVVIVPLRTFCPPEIALLTLRRGDPGRVSPQT